jgi:hypothetical protein
VRTAFTNEAPGQGRRPGLGALLLICVAILPLVFLSIRARSCQALDSEPATEPGPGPQASADLSDHCLGFVAFNFRCGIGKPPPDSTLDVGIARNNELVIMGELAHACRMKRPPFDEAILRCYLEAGEDCARYDSCRLKVIEQRGR